MQKYENYSLPGGGSVKCEWDNSYVHIKSRINLSQKDSALFLRVCTNDKKSLCLGSYAPSENGFYLEKSYPRAYFEAKGIQKNEISHFSISNKNNCDEGLYEDVSTPRAEDEFKNDFAVKRARDVLKSFEARHTCFSEAKIFRDKISRFFGRHSAIGLSVAPGYTWVKMDDIRQSFGLSSVEHVIFCEFFVRAYVRWGYWLFGKAPKEGFYGICVHCDENMPNPMENVSDCVIQWDDEAKKGKYYAVGIGVFDNGQYFYKIEE